MGIISSKSKLKAVKNPVNEEHDPNNSPVSVRKENDIDQEEEIDTIDLLQENLDQPSKNDQREEYESQVDRGNFDDHPITEAEKLRDIYRKEKELGVSPSSTPETKKEPKESMRLQYKTYDYHDSGREISSNVTEKSDEGKHVSTENTSVEESKAKSADEKSNTKETNDKDLPKKSGDDSNAARKLRPLKLDKFVREKNQVRLELEKEGLLPGTGLAGAVEVDSTQQGILGELRKIGIVQKVATSDVYTLSSGAPTRRPPPRLPHLPTRTADIAPDTLDNLLKPAASRNIDNILKTNPLCDNTVDIELKPQPVPINNISDMFKPRPVSDVTLVSMPSLPTVAGNTVDITLDSSPSSIVDSTLKAHLAPDNTVDSIPKPHRVSDDNVGSMPKLRPESDAIVESISQSGPVSANNTVESTLQVDSVSSPKPHPVFDNTVDGMTTSGPVSNNSEESMLTQHEAPNKTTDSPLKPCPVISPGDLPLQSTRTAEVVLEQPPPRPCPTADDATNMELLKSGRSENVESIRKSIPPLKKPGHRDQLGVAPAPTTTTESDSNSEYFATLGTEIVGDAQQLKLKLFDVDML